MPFIKKNDSQDAQPSSPFIGRINEIHFFVHNILQPETPTHNILSISGQGGVGKSTLLARFIDEARSANFKDYCLTASVDERQAIPISIMEKFAQQLHLTGKFEKALKQYKEALQRRHMERETLRDRLFESLPDVAGAVVEGIPVAGPLLREGTKSIASHLLKEHQASQVQQDTELLKIPIDNLTTAFVAELNRLADTKAAPSSTGKKRQRRIVLFFDTFEQLAAEATPWFLDHFLAAQISSNVVLVVAGRDPIEHTSPNDPKRWLPYCDDGTIYSISLNSFTEHETRMYLVKRGITDANQIANIWQLSRGLPLYLGLLTSNLHRDIDPTKGVVVNFLRWIPEQESIKRQLALDAALLSRPFDEDDLEVFSYIPQSDRARLYQWLTEQPFVRNRVQDGRHLYHDVARDLFSRHLYQLSQKRYAQIRGDLAAYYQQLLEKIQAKRGEEAYCSEEGSELLLAVISQLLLLPDRVSHILAIEHVLRAYENTNEEQQSAIARMLHELSQKPSLPYISPAAREIAVQLLHYIEADFRSREWLMATGTLLENVAHAPSFPPDLLAGLYERRAHAYSYLGAVELTRENLQQALKLLEPTNYQRRGNIYWYVRNYQEALASQNCALEQNPRDVSAYIQRGWAYRNLGEYQQALADFNQALKLDPNNRDVYNGQGWLYCRMGAYQQAIQSFEYLLELEPQNLSALRGLGITYQQLKEYQQAITLFDRCLELDARNPWFHLGRSECHLSLKEYQQSIEDCNYVLELAPKRADVYIQRGLIYLWLKNLQQAQADFTKSYELEPTQIRPALMAEWTRICRRTDDSSVPEQLEAIAKVAPQSHTAYTSRGIALLLRRNLREALAELEQAHLSNSKRWENHFWSNRWEAHFWKGMAYAFLGQDEEAIAAIEQALDLELPPILLTPLRWFEQERPDFYRKYSMPLLAKHV